MAETFVFGQLKSNLGPPVLATIEYQLRGIVTGWDGELGKPIRSSALAFGQTVPVKVTEMVLEDGVKRKDPAPARSKARDWLLEYLRSRGATAVALVRDDATGEGFAWPTVERAKRDSGCVSLRDESGQMLWQAPAAYVSGK